jgi:hypothetical protein
MGWKKFLITLLLLTIFSCANFYRHPQGGFRPNTPKFTLHKKNYSLNTQIDTMAIYLRADTSNCDPERIVFFLKFHNNGRFFFNGFQYDIGFSKNNTTPLLIGYYSLNKDSITIERFNANVRTKTGKYVKQKGIIKGDTLFFKSQFITNKKDIYIKRKIDFIVKPSDW